MYYPRKSTNKRDFKANSNPPAEPGGYYFGAFMRGNKPPVLLGAKKASSKAKTGELKASPSHLPTN